MLGRTIAHYRIVSQVGSGGMGVVYRAEDIRLGRDVALKFVSEDLRQDEHAMSRLRSEARAASALNHPNICTIFDVGEDDGHPFIVMELLRGQTLRERLLSGPLKTHHLVDIGIDIADALHATHADGVIHRDIKPGNIFLTERGPVKLLDFGLAKLTPTYGGTNTTFAAIEQTVAGVTLGTVAYMSPEQSSGEELDGRTDLFSLGVVLYECATGRHPFPGKTPAVVLSGILSRAPVAPVTINPDLPVRLQEVINNCLEKDRELRYQSAADLRADLKRLRRDLESGHSRPVEIATAVGRPGSGAHPSEPVVPGSGPATPVPVASSSRGRVVAAASVGAVVLAGGLYAVWPRSAAPVATPPSEITPAPVDDRLARATASLQARNYRAALGYASEVLSADGSNAEARRIHDEAEQALSRFDAAVADARRQLAAGNVAGAAEAIETARDLDATAPSTIELASRLAALVREQDAARERPARPTARATPPERPLPAPGPTPSRAAAPAQTPPAPSPPVATSGAPQSTAAAAPPPPPVTAPPPSATPPPVTPPPVTASPPEPTPDATPRPAPPRTEPAPSPAPPAPAPSAPEPPRAAAGEADEAVIRQVVATYGRAIETKDLALFRTIKPNLSAGEERRLQDGFRAVGAQQVALTVTSIDHRGDTATVVANRRDTVDIGGRRQVVEARQTLSMARVKGTWVITDIR